MNKDIVTKKCTKCNSVKRLIDFNKDSAKLGGVRGYCRSCDNAKSTMYRRTKVGLINVIYGSQKGSSKRRKMDPPNYSKEELKEWMLSQKIFHALYKNWVSNGYKRDDYPSVDRKNDYKSYTIDNIQLMTWKKNNLKGNCDIKRGKNNKQARAVIKLTKDDKYIESYFSINEAERQTGLKKQNIIATCKGRTMFTGGYKWKYKEITGVVA